MPGTLMNVTPEIMAPTIANATTGHGAVRPPVKNVELSAPRELRRPTSISSRKYAAMVRMTITGMLMAYSA
jgi:hypothetical protein